MPRCTCIPSTIELCIAASLVISAVFLCGAFPGQEGHAICKRKECGSEVQVVHWTGCVYKVRVRGQSMPETLLNDLIAYRARDELLLFYWMLYGKLDASGWTGKPCMNDGSFCEFWHKLGVQGLVALFCQGKDKCSVPFPLQVLVSCSGRRVNLQ